MHSGMYILADDTGDLVKFAIFAIIGIFWVIAQIAARLNKPKGVQKMPPPKLSPQPTRPIAIQNKYPAAIVQKAQAMQRAQVQRAQAMARKPAPAPKMVRPLAAGTARRPLPPPLRAPAPRVVAPPPVIAPAPAMPDRTAMVQRRLPPASVAAANVLGLRADGLRQQIILAEILQPPVGLR